MNYSNKTVDELKDICRERKIQGISGKKKQELIDMIKQFDAVSVSAAIKPQAKSKSGMSENIKITISEVENTSPRSKVEPVIPLVKGGYYWYQKNKTDIPEYIKIIEIHKEGNDYYYTILMRNKSEKQTIGQYLFNWRKPPLYSLLPGETKERCRKMYDYGFIQGQFSINTEDSINTADIQRELRFEDIVPKNEEDRKRLNCVYNQAVKETIEKVQAIIKRDEINKIPLPKTEKEWLEYFNKPYNHANKINGDPWSAFKL
jgi:hypothetical protein